MTHARSRPTDTPAAERARQPDRDAARSARPASAGAPRATTSASSATTSTARRRPGFTPSAGQPDRPADRHELHRHRPRAPAPTTTRCRPRMRPATSARPRTRRARVVGDTTPPSAPGTLSASGAIGKATLSWGAATDNVGVVALRRLPLDDLRLHAQRRPTGSPSRAAPSYIDTGSRPGTYYYKVHAEDAAGNLGPASNEASAVVLADTTPPSAPGQPERLGRRRHGQPQLEASSDDVGVAALRRLSRHQLGFTPRARNRIAQPTGTGYSDSGTVGRHLLLQGAGRGCGRQPQPVLERGLGDRRRHHAAERAERPGRERDRRERSR